MNTCGDVRVYIHYPFCISKCPFCAFPTTCDFTLEKEYIRALIKEINDYTFTGKIVSLFFGGGSPSNLCPDVIREIISHLSVFLTEDAEITIELNPQDCVPDFAVKYRSVGINRISIGVQSFVPSKLNLLKRKPLPPNYDHPKDFNISFDIIIGTRFDETCIQNEIENILFYKPNHVSVYPLSIESGSFFDRQAPNCIVDNVGIQYEAYNKLLAQIGYVRYESSNFYEQTGGPCKHNMGYWLNADFKGFGMAAHSKIGGRSWHNPLSLTEYIEVAFSEESKPYYELLLSEEEFAEQTLLMGMRLTDGILLSSVLGGISDTQKLMKKITLLAENDCLSIASGILRPTTNLNFGKCLNLLGWDFEVRSGWRSIVPRRS